MKMKKALALLLCAVLLVAGSVLGTIAYLTDDDSVENTFTVGKVYINLNETDVTKTDGSKTETGNAYHLIPGSTYVKDPTVTVLANSEECYVRMIMTIDKKADVDNAFDKIAEMTDIFEGYDANTWVLASQKQVDDTMVYEFRYNGTVAKSASDTVLAALFTGIKVPDAIENEALALLDGLKIDIEAHAIQVAGFADADAAWVAFGA